MKQTLLSAVSALAFLAAGSAFAAASPTITRDGCEWKKAENSNYFTRVNPGCKIGHNGNAPKPAKNSGGGEEPTDPTDPEEPVDPVDPTDPTDPVDPGPTDPVDPTDPTDPGDGTDPTDPTDPSDPEPTDPKDPKPCKGKKCDGGGKPKDPKPGHGHGDDNHDHSGPPGQNKD